MSRSATSVGCPYCGTEVTADLDGSAYGGVNDDQLKGTELACDRCSGRFEMYFY